MVKRTGHLNKPMNEKSSNVSKGGPKVHTCPFCGVVSSDVKFMKPHISQHIREQVSATKGNQGVNTNEKREDPSQKGETNDTIKSIKSPKIVKVENKKEQTSDKIKSPKIVKVETNKEQFSDKIKPIKSPKIPKVENTHSFEINVNAEDFVLTNIKEENKLEESFEEEDPPKEPRTIKVKFFTDPPSDKPPLKSQSQLSKYRCEICSSDQDDSGAHLLFSHGMLACGKDDRCHQFFSSMEVRRRHEEDAHNDAKDSAAAWKDTCGACQERMSDLCTLVEHRMERHSLNTCTLCGIIMNGREHFAKHVKTHNIRNVDIYNLKPEYPILEKMLNSPIGMFDGEAMSVECNLCPLKTENLDYAWKTVKVGEGGIKLLHHYEYAHKVKNPAPTVLKLFNGSEFHYKTLKVKKDGDKVGKRKVGVEGNEGGWNKKKKVSKAMNNIDEDPDDPEVI